MTDDERATRGRQAKAEFRQLEAAFQQLADAMTIKMLGASEPATILELHSSIQTLGKVRKAMLMMAQDGELAEFAMQQAELAN